MIAGSRHLVRPLLALFATAAVCACIATPVIAAEGWRARVSARLLSVYDSARRSGAPTASSASVDHRAPRLDATGRVQVDVHYDCSLAAPLAALASAGLHVNASVAVAPLCVVEGWAAPAALADIASVAGVASVTVPTYVLHGNPPSPRGPTGPLERALPRGAPREVPRERAQPLGAAIDGTGVTIMRADQFIAQTRTAGAGVTVGVQSTGVTSLSVIQQRGELPAVQVLTPGSQSSPGYADEGTALLEEVHAVAPQAALAFCGPQTFVEYTACLGQLIGAGATILVDDVIFVGPDLMSADNADAQAVEQILSRNPSVALFTAVGNYNGSYWEGPYAPVTLASQSLPALDCPAGSAAQHDAYVAEFNGSPSEQLSVSQPGTYPMTFAWADPSSRNASNFDVYWSSNTDASQSGCFSTASVSGNLITPSLGLAAGTYTVYIATPDASLAGKFLKLWIGGDGLTFLSATSPGAIVSAQAFAPGAITVGAVNGSDGIGDGIEKFSSLGPLSLFFPAATQVQAPVLTAPDGIYVDAAGTYFAGMIFADGNFYGTSASVPNAGAVAALLRAAFPSLTAVQLLQALTAGAAQLGVGVPDATFGYGRIDALGALAEVPGPTITALPDSTIDAGASSPAYAFTVSGTGNLHFIVTSSNAALVPAALVPAGSPGVTLSPSSCGITTMSCTLAITAAAGFGGTTGVTISAVDGANRSAPATMNVTVNGPPPPSMPAPTAASAPAPAGSHGGGGALGPVGLALLALLAALSAAARREDSRPRRGPCRPA